jgi:hypothetical protein
MLSGLAQGLRRRSIITNANTPITQQAKLRSGGIRPEEHVGN